MAQIQRQKAEYEAEQARRKAEEEAHKLHEEAKEAAMSQPVITDLDGGTYVQDADKQGWTKHDVPASAADCKTVGRIQGASVNRRCACTA